MNVLEALKDKSWKVATDEELYQLLRNETWMLVTPLESCKPIDLKWVFKIKWNADGKIIKHKSQLVVKRVCTKVWYGFIDVFAPIERLETIKALAISAYFGCKVHHLDVKLAFLNGEI